MCYFLSIITVIVCHLNASDAPLLLYVSYVAANSIVIVDNCAICAEVAEADQ